MSGVFSEVQAERERQNVKWGEQNHPDGTGPRMAVPGRLCYEADAARDARLHCQAAAYRGECTWRDILREEVYEAFAESDPAALRTELIQVAAVAVQWVQAIDRREEGEEGFAERMGITEEDLAESDAWQERQP